jgi:hypothetical protein
MAAETAAREAAQLWNEIIEIEGRGLSFAEVGNLIRNSFILFRGNNPTTKVTEFFFAAMVHHYQNETETQAT